MGLPLVGALLGGVGSLLSGFGAKSRAKKEKKMLMGMFDQMVADADHAQAVPLVQTQDSTVDLAAMRKAAEGAGFNAVSALRAGLGSAFTRTTSTTTGHNAGLTAQLIGQYLSSGNTPKEPASGLEVMGGALSAGSSIFTDLTNKAIDQGIQQIAQSGYINGLSRSGKGGSSALFSVPSIITAGAAIKSLGGTGPSAASLRTSGPNSIFKPMPDEGPVLQGSKGRGPTLNLPFVGNVNLTNRSSGDDIEEVLGDADALTSVIGGARIAESIDLNRRLSFGNVHKAAVGWLSNAAWQLASDAASEVTNWGRLITPGAGKPVAPSGWKIGPNGYLIPTGR